MTVRTTSTSAAPTARCTSSTWPPGRTKSRCLRRPSRARSATRPSITISPRSTSGPRTATSTPSRRRSRGGPMRVARSVLYGLVGTLLLFSLVGAVPARVFGEGPQAREDCLGQTSTAGRALARGVAAPPASTPPASTPPASPQPNRPQVREVFFGEREETVCQPGGREFVLENLRDLQVCIVWAGLSGTYWTQLEFQSPDGHVYQTMTQAFVTPEATATVGAVEVQGRPYQVRRAGWARPGEAAGRAKLPGGRALITPEQ